MAPKKPNPMEDPPAASSEEEESSSEEEEEEEEDSSSEEEDESPPKPKPTPPPPSQKQQPPKNPETTTTTTTQTLSSTSESDSGSEDSESDSQSEPEKTLPPTITSPDPTVKPIATKPMEETPPKTTKPRSKLAATPIKSTAKRPIENDRDSKDSKKVKKSGSDDGGTEESSKKSTEDPKKQVLFQRKWSEDDEIAVLKGMLEYSAKKGVDPMTDMNAFLDYIKNGLQFDANKSQLHEKVRRLKKKYENNLSKEKKGEHRSFSKEHDQKSYDLSKKIWGGEAVESSVAAAASKLNGKTAKKTQTPRPNGKALPTPKLVALPEVKKMEIDGNESEMCSINEMAVSVASMDDYVLKRGLELVDGGKRAELEERWRKLQLAQLELFVERSQLVYEQAKLVLEAAKLSNH